MSRRAIVLLAATVLLAAAGAFWLLQDREEERVEAPVETPVEDAPEGPVEPPAADGAATDARVRVSSPSPNVVVSSPLVVRGEARGQWYFEADFPVRLVDARGRELAVAPATAGGEWMTGDFVPFEVTLTFEPPATQTGILILERSNASGLAEHAAMVAVPVRFGEDAPPRKAVRAYFNSTAYGDEVCEAVWPVARAVAPTGDDTAAEARAALAELLRGPTPAERDRGYLTNIPEGVELRSLRVEEGTAYADFGETMHRAAGSCRVLAIRAQIERTLLQFPTVDDVVISVDGNVEEALQP